MQSVLGLFEDVMESVFSDEVDEQLDDEMDGVVEFEAEEEEFSDIENWIDPEPLDLFLDSIGVSEEAVENANAYYDDAIGSGNRDSLELLETLNGNKDERNTENEEIAHRLKLFMGPSN